jgi:hypothetical protein
MLKTHQVLNASTHLSISYYGYKPLQISLFGSSKRKWLVTNSTDEHFYGLENLRIVVRFSDEGTVSSVLRSIQTVSGAHQVTYSLGSGGSLFGRKRPERGAEHSAV